MRYSLCRILGNDLPPRDSRGNRARSLRFMLENEPQLPQCEKKWLLNQIHSPKLRDEMIDALQSHGHTWRELKFDKTEYEAQSDRQGKLRCAININKARNLAISMGGGSRIVFAFDGDC